MPFKVGDQNSEDHILLKHVLTKFCPRCILQHICFSWEVVFQAEDEIVKYLFKKCSTSVAFLSTLQYADNKDNKVNTALECCHSCLGLLTTSFLNNCITQLNDSLSNNTYQFTTFKAQYFLPVQLHIFSKYSQNFFAEKFPHTTKCGHEVKEIFKAMMEFFISKNVKFVQNVDSSLEVAVYISHSQTETSVLPRIASVIQEPTIKQKRKRQKSCQNNTIYTAAKVISAIEQLDKATLKEICSLIGESSHVEKILLFHTPVYVGGRYNKYSRELPQTPWLIEGERKLEYSVQEYVALPIQKAFSADSYNFSSSGREDVDVRMLGNGRPFLIELINPKQSKMNDDKLFALQSFTNEQTTDVSISSIKIVNKEQSKKLKEGEEQKTKSYTALCCFVQQPSREQIDKLQQISSTKNIVLKQKTPVRVLHRRPLATRIRMVHSLTTETGKRNDNRLFKLNLSTQAGTYVKEFVHGDFGRTTPSLGELLGAEVDIINLDVQSVNLDWPPNL